MVAQEDGIVESPAKSEVTSTGSRVVGFSSTPSSMNRESRRVPGTTMPWKPVDLSLTLVGVGDLTALAEISGVAAGVYGPGRHHEPQPVHRRELAPAPDLGERYPGPGVHQAGVRPRRRSSRTSSPETRRGRMRAWLSDSLLARSAGPARDRPAWRRHPKTGRVKLRSWRRMHRSSSAMARAFWHPSSLSMLVAKPWRAAPRRSPARAPTARKPTPGAPGRRGRAGRGTSPGWSPAP